MVWVEGEPGIGKSSLVAEALAAGSGPGWDIGWGIADKLTERLPLQVVLDCLRVRPGSPDPRRARAGDLLSSRRLGLFADGDASVAGVEVLVALADELSAAAPTVLVVDDLQWADEASLIVWHQLAASIDQLRLLLIGTCRPTPRPEVQQVRAAVVRRGGAVITLGPLPETDVAALVTAMVGAPPGDTLRRLTARAAGNPLYVRELVDALVREQALEIRPTAEVSVAREQLPASLTAVLSDRLSSVSAETAQMLRTAALLGGRFAVTDLAVVLRRPVSDLAAGLQEAVAAGILAGSGPELAFRHLLIQQALYGSMPAALSTALHAEAARELAVAGADALSVAQQLSAANRPGEGWARTWLIESAPALVIRAPQLAADLLRRELDEAPAGEEALDGLMANLVRALLAAGSYQEAARRADRALTVMTDPLRRAETSWMLARAQMSAGDKLCAPLLHAQWLDPDSAQALAFAARHLAAAPVAVVLAFRQPGGERELTGLPELPVGGLADGDAQALRAQVAADPHPSRLIPGARCVMAPGARVTGNLPAELTSFVGRRGELAEVKQLLAGSRLVTLTGVGGVGKTRLALRAAAGLARAFPGGVWLVRLDQLREEALVAQAVAGALGLQDRAGYAPAAALADYLAGRQLLLVLDNCEHLVDAAAKLADLLLRAAAGLRVLATSREALIIDGEMVLPVPPLPVPEAGRPLTAAGLGVFPAVRLFAERAAQVVPGFAVTEANMAAVAGICRRLEGLPLAIELAAAQLPVLSPEQIDERLGDRLGLLTRGGRAGRPGSRRCGPRSGGVMSCAAGPSGCCGRGCRCSPAGSSWTRPRASAPMTGWPPGQVLELLAALAGKSILTAAHGAGRGPVPAAGDPARVRAGTPAGVRRGHGAAAAAPGLA